MRKFMTTIDIPQANTERFFTANPYALTLHGEGSEIVADATKTLIASEIPYIDKSTNPDIGAFSVYKLDARHPLSFISRAIEGTVIMDEGWEKSPESIRAKTASYEDNSFFFLVIDSTDLTDPKPVASLRIADVLAGGSETQDFYVETYGSAVKFPSKLQVSDVDQTQGLWDIVGVMTDPERRGDNNDATAWAYHSLYTASLNEGVHRWVSNITDKEFRNLNNLGIPFVQIENTEKVLVEREGGKHPIPFGFYDLDVDNIRTSTESVITNLESATDHLTTRLRYASLARIALNGQLAVEFHAIEAA
jgi:hypothetical protein